jgi:hypothetical protein
MTPQFMPFMFRGFHETLLVIHQTGFFYDFCWGFFNHDICMQSINGSYITLIPKIDNPTKVGDFRPISLPNNSVKLVTKVLANILQKVILRDVHQN